MTCLSRFLHIYFFFLSKAKCISEAVQLLCQQEVDVFACFLVGKPQGTLIPWLIEQSKTDVIYGT